ncbi:MAG: MGMT family protein, partial [Rhodocyclaceae bacterium]|nr:MGMT family protein [Rhodocyclaceae bacterium]
MAVVGSDPGRVLGFGTTRAMLDTLALYQLVRRIPKGKVATYGQLAK